MRFDETIKINTVFGNVEIKYINKKYTATMLNGSFNGWNAEGTNRDTTLASLLKEVAERYSMDIIAESI